MRNTGREINDSRANEYLIDFTFPMSPFVARVVWVKCPGGVFECNALRVRCERLRYEFDKNLAATPETGKIFERSI